MSETSLRTILVGVGRHIVLGAVVGVLCGAGAALFLSLLQAVTVFRTGHEQLVFALPLAGLGLGFFYQRFGQPIAGGTNLVVTTLNDGGPPIPLRMAPMVVLGTIVTHAFGGSAGREGTAVQMGASLADQVAWRLQLSAVDRRWLLTAGVAGGFGAIFGTPVAGCVFALELVVVRGRFRLDALLAALVASIVGDLTTRAFGVGHSHFPQSESVALTPLLLLKWVVFAAAVALVTVAFIELTTIIKKYSEQYLPRLPWRMFVGGVVVVVLWQIVGTSDYLGLGVEVILRAFVEPDLPAGAFVLKLVFTAITIGVGFIGGEVTPLFFIGAALGNVLAQLLGIPLDLAAAVGLAAVFGAAANTPLALSIMAVELFGAAVLPHVVVVTVVARLLKGRRSIYAAQIAVHDGPAA